MERGRRDEHRRGGALYRGTSLIRKRHPPGPYSRAMERYIEREGGGEPPWRRASASERFQHERERATLTGFSLGKALERRGRRKAPSPVPLFHLSALSRHTRILSRQNIKPIERGRGEEHRRGDALQQGVCCRDLGVECRVWV